MSSLFSSNKPTIFIAGSHPAMTSHHQHRSSASEGLNYAEMWVCAFVCMHSLLFCLWLWWTNPSMSGMTVFIFTRGANCNFFCWIFKIDDLQDLKFALKLNYFISNWRITKPLLITSIVHSWFIYVLLIKKNFIRFIRVW